MPKIKLKIKNKDLVKLILDDLEKKIKSGIELTLDLEESKETMSYICNSPCIEDWDYVAGPKIEPPHKNGFFDNLEIEKGDWNKLAWTIEAIHKLAQKSPAIKYQSEFWYSALKQNLTKIPTPEHALLTITTQSYYSNYDWELIEEDLEDKLKKLWNEMNKITLTELATKLYKK